MNWELRSTAGEAHATLATDVLREAVFRGDVSPETWIRAAGSSEWRQLATVDEFAGSVSGSRRRRVQPAEEDDGVDMTPMIDCTFLLLIFFMITATFHLQKGLDFPPDQTQDSSQAQQNLPGLGDFADRIILEIGQGDVFSLRDANSGAQDQAATAGLDPKKLVAILKQQARDTKKTRVLVLAHELASHEAVVLAIDSCGQAGLRDVSLADVTGQPLPASGGGSAVIRRD